MCHLALLLPVVGLGVFFVLPLPWALAAYLVIAGATALLYKAVIDAMRRRVVTGREALLGARVAVRRVEPGRLVVCLGGELWTAQGAGFDDGGPRPGDHVVISQVRGNTLVVSPLATSATV